MSNRSPRHFHIVLLAVGMAAIACGASVTATPISSAVVAALTATPTSKVALASPTATSVPNQEQVVALSTLPPPLKDVAFPQQTITYPANWPVEIRFPDTLSLVEATSGTLPDSATTGWGAKFRYSGNPQAAGGVVISALNAMGWRLEEQTELDSGGMLLVVQNDTGGTGIIVIDTDPVAPGSSLVVTTLFP
jgi:hypothetical protein